MKMEHMRKKLAVAAAILILIALIVAIGVSESIVESNNIVFRVCFGILLSFLACLQLYTAAVLFVNRGNTLLELAQPVGLAIFSVSGSIATACAFSLALPEYDVACALRQPIILTCIALMGSILVARSWRISCIICPTLEFAASGDREGNLIHSARSKLMGVLTKLSMWSLVMGRCGRGARTGKKSTIRQQVTFADSLRVTAILLVPQIILQIVNLCLPGVRMHSVEIDEGLFACESDVGPWFLALGVVVASLPFFFALLLNIKNVGMPDLFREYDQLATCMRASVNVLLISLPTIAMIDQTISNAHAYLVAGSLMSFVLPLNYYISFLRLSGIRTKAATKKQLKSAAASIPASSGDDPGTLQMAENSTTMAVMFQNMGRHEKAIEVRKGILSMFKKDEEYKWQHGYDKAEIEYFGPRSLVVVATTLVDLAKHQSASVLHQYLEPIFQEDKVRMLVDEIVKEVLEAMKIFETCPAKKLLKDNRVIFPAYSYIDGLTKYSAPYINLQNSESLFEFDKSNSCKFVLEAQSQLFHYCRALAMEASALASNQQYHEAIAVVNKMKTIYDPSMHSTALEKEYATDKCAAAVAVCALYYQRVNLFEQAAEVCDDVITRILPEIEAANANGINWMNLTLFMIPLTQALRKQGQDGAKRAWKLFNAHIFDPFTSASNQTTHAKTYIRPLAIVLQCCSSIGTYDGIEEDGEWLLDSGGGEVSEGPDNYSTIVLGVSFFSLLSEACLHLAKRLNGDKRKRALIAEGLRFSSLAEPNMKDKNGEVTNDIVFQAHAPIQAELGRLSKMLEYKYSEEGESVGQLNIEESVEVPVKRSFGQFNIEESVKQGRKGSILHKAADSVKRSLGQLNIEESIKQSELVNDTQ